MIIGMLLVKNESNRYLEKVLDQMTEICNLIIAIDDASTDNTVEILDKYGVKYFSSKISLFEKDELYLRKINWDIACKYASDGDWILHVDADEIFTDINFKDKIKIAESRNFDCLCVKLYDMWNQDEYREDEFWNAHKNYFPVAVRYDSTKDYKWRNQKLHCGPFPFNAYEKPLYSEIDILHYGWSKEEDRIKKYEFYKRVDIENIGNKKQYETILDKNPTLKKYYRKKILIGAPVRQDEETFVKYLDSLKKLKVIGYELEFYFILHNSPHLKKYLNNNEYEEFESNNQYIKNEKTHVWEENNLKDVIIMKNKLLDKTLIEKYDYFFLVDSDIILHEDTLQHLVNQNKDIIAEVFWTQWTPDKDYEPNAWTHDFYSFDNLQRIEDWKVSNVYEVGGTGACILIKDTVIKKGVNYYPIKNISFSLWEDRAFCIRAIIHGFKIYLDTHYPAIHLYR